RSRHRPGSWWNRRRRPARRGTSPARCRIGRRDKLRRNLGGSTEGSIIKHGHILLDRPASRFRWQPLFALDPVLPVGIRLDQAGIDRKPFAADKTFTDTALEDHLEHPAQQIALAKAAMTVLRKGRMIGYVAIEPQPTEPSVCNIKMNLIA